MLNRLDAPAAGAHTERVDSVLLVILVVAAVLSAGRRGARVVRDEWRKIAEQRRPPAPSTVPIEQVTATLRRLRRELESRENRPGLTGKGMRMGAVRFAYVDVLAVACRQLDVPPPRGGRDWQTPLAEIYRVEAALRARGLDVRDPVGHAA